MIVRRPMNAFVFRPVASRLLPLAFLTAALSVAGGQKLPPRPQAGEGEPGFGLTITSFASTRAYAVNTGSITLVGTVRNGGSAGLPPETVLLRMYALNGLEYLEGATTIRLPAIEPGASATYRWKVQPTSPDAPLVAALSLERPGHVPQIRVLPIQHFAQNPGSFGNGAPPKPEPSARASSTSGWLDNGKVRLRALHTDSEVAGGFLWTKANGGWRQVGLALPFVEVLSAESAQEPWWEMMKAKRYAASSSRNRAVLGISGPIGVRWRAEVGLSLNAGSSVVDAELRLSPRRRMSLYALRLARLYAGEGSFGAQASETLGPEPIGRGLASAIRWGTVTTGVMWPAQPPYPGWTQALLPTPDGAQYRVLGVEYRAGADPLQLPANATLSIRWRMYAISPSASVRDALRVSF